MWENYMERTEDKLIIDNFLDEDVRREIFIETQLHFKKNLYASDEISNTNCIIDCHGLALSKSKYFPYEVNCWNIFCLKVKEQVVKYCQKYGYDSFDVIPYSCFAERHDDNPQQNFNLNSEKIDENSLLSSLCERIYHTPKSVVDESGQVNKHMIRAVYTLLNYVESCGTFIYYDDVATKVLGNENGLIIFDGSYSNTNVYVRSELINCKKYSIIFDWYINDPFDVPDWILP